MALFHLYKIQHYGIVMFSEFLPSTSKLYSLSATLLLYSRERFYSLEHACIPTFKAPPNPKRLGSRFPRFDVISSSFGRRIWRATQFFLGFVCKISHTNFLESDNIAHHFADIGVLTRHIISNDTTHTSSTAITNTFTRPTSNKL
jgi:hypothetical protein